MTPNVKRFSPVVRIEVASAACGPDRTRSAICCSVLPSAGGNDVGSGFCASRTASRRPGVSGTCSTGSAGRRGFSSAAAGGECEAGEHGEDRAQRHPS